MIELRWVERSVVVGVEGYGDSAAQYVTVERVLQYREGNYSDLQWDEKKGDYIEGKFWIGTEWRDVPTVREE